MGKEHFFHRESAEIVKGLDEVGRHAGVSRGQAFEDFLLLVLASLSGGRMEEQYLQTVKRYAAGEQGKRAIDQIVRLFANLVKVMEETRADILGDVFQGGITYGEAGQFLTPESLTKLVADLTVDSEARTICDPCCGSGRMLLAASQKNPRAELIGQDVDLRCVRMTAINLALWNRYGYVLWGNSLALEKKLVYRTGFDGQGVVREIPLEECPAPVQQVAKKPSVPRPEDGGGSVQGSLF